MPQKVTLTAGAAECVLCPEMGGSILGWRIDGQEMLRHADDAAIASRNPLELASFPLVPFSNRIGYGRFDWQGETVQIDPNFAPEPHALHGVGWKGHWEISELSDVHCVVSLNHKADSRWPWSFLATQTVTLGNGSLDIALEAVNMSEEPTPLAFGYHPYFDQRGAYLAFRSDRVFMSGADGLPAYSISPSGMFDFNKGERVEGRNIDHCYAGWNGEARIMWENRQLGLVTTSNMPAAVVYIPDGGDAFCFEPVPHINNALNRPGDEPSMPIVQPGSSYKSNILMAAVAAEKICDRGLESA